MASWGKAKRAKRTPVNSNTPPIHGLPEEELLKAMADYREIWQKKSYNRKDKRMAKSAGRLSDEEVKAVIAFITSQLDPKEK